MTWGQGFKYNYFSRKTHVGLIAEPHCMHITKQGCKLWPCILSLLDQCSKWVPKKDQVLSKYWWFFKPTDQLNFMATCLCFLTETVFVLPSQSRKLDLFRLLHNIQVFPVTGKNSFWPATWMTENYCTFQSEGMNKKSDYNTNTDICIQQSLTTLLCKLHLLSNTQFYDYNTHSYLLCDTVMWKNVQRAKIFIKRAPFST